MIKPRLSIAVPTYRRRTALESTLRALAVQIGTQQIPILVLNNDAEHPIRPEDMPDMGSVAVVVHNNRYNIGGNSNVLRCLEYAESDYVWLLADDDVLSPNAVTTILADLAIGNPMHVNYGLPGSLRRARVDAVGLAAYIDAIDRLNDLWLISNWVFRVDGLRDALRGACNMITSCAPHIVLALEMLRDSQAVGVFSHRPILGGHMAHGENAGWSILNFCLRRGVWLTIELPGPQRRRLREKMIAVMPFLDHCALALALRAIRTRDVRDAREQYRFIYETNVRGLRSFSLWARYRLLELLLHFPRVVRWLAAFKKGKPFVERLEAFDHDART